MYDNDVTDIQLFLSSDKQQTAPANQGSRNRGSRVSGCSPNFWGGGAVLPRKFVDVTDWRWWLVTGGSRQHSFVSALYQINKTCRLLGLRRHWCCASFIRPIAYLKPAIRDTNLLDHALHGVHFDRFAAKWLKRIGFFSARRCIYAHRAQIVLQFGRYRPSQGIMAPKILSKMANISVFGVLRPNYSGVACLLLRMDAHSCCYRLW